MDRLDNLARLDFARSRDELLLDLAAVQHRVVCLDDLRTIGFTGPAIKAAVRARRLFRLFRGVYAVGTPDLDVFGRALAALLAVGAAAISHRTAGSMWTVLDYDGPIELTARSHRRRRPGMIIHQSQSLADGDIRILNGIPVTAPARTLVDLADVLDADALDQARSQTHFLGYISRTVPNRPGRRAVAKRPMTRSQLERGDIRRLRQAGDPLPETNVLVCGYEADAFFRAERVVLEFDDYRTPGDERTFQRDRDKGNAYLVDDIWLALTRRLLERRRACSPAAS